LLKVGLNTKNQIKSWWGVLDTLLSDKEFSDLWQFGGFILLHFVLQFPPPIKLIATILLKVALKTIILTLTTLEEYIYSLEYLRSWSHHYIVCRTDDKGVFMFCCINWSYYWAKCSDF
jgi:hypothetical protein